MLTRSRRQPEEPETPLKVLLEIEQRLVTEFHHHRMLADLRQSSLETMTDEVERRASELSSSVATLPESLGGSHEEGLDTLTMAVRAIRGDLQVYGLTTGAALLLTVALLVVAILWR